MAEREHPMANALILFVIIPTAGKTKIKLTPFLSAEEYAMLNRCFAKDVYQKAGKTDADVYVFLPPGSEKYTEKSLESRKTQIFRKGFV